MSKNKLRREKRLQETDRLGTWNVQGGLTQPAAIEVLGTDLNGRRMGICCLQETLNPHTYDQFTSNGDLFIFFGRQENNLGGLGFFVSREWKDRLESTQLITERIAIARFHRSNPEAQALRGKRGDLVILNVYGHTQMQTQRDPSLATKFWQKVKEVYEKERAGSQVILIMGDMNSKIGKPIEGEEEIMGKYGKGQRNNNGTAMRDFLAETGLYLANTRYQKRPMQIATWHHGRPPPEQRGPTMNARVIQRRQRRNERRRSNQPGIHNQIDFIMVPKRENKLYSNATAVMAYEFEHRSDHSLVEIHIQLRVLYKYKQTKAGGKGTKRDMDALVDDQEIRDKYQLEVATKLEHIDDAVTLPLRYETIKQVLIDAAIATLPIAPRKVNGKVIYTGDRILTQLSSKQKGLTKRIYHPTNERNPANLPPIKEKRNRVFQKLRDRRKKLEVAHWDRLASRLQDAPNSRQAFEISRVMRKGKPTSLMMTEPDGSLIRQDGRKITLLTTFYSGFFRKEGMAPLDPWIGDPRPLQVPFTEAEIAMALSRLNNKRAPGPDNLESELWKYGGPVMQREIAKMLNEIFTTHISIQEIKNGYLIPLNKLTKPLDSANTRPIILLTTLRKILSTSGLVRFTKKVGEYLDEGVSQHAYRQNRSTTEVIWTMQFIKATTEKYAERARVMGIDLSKAFDCLDRTKLMNILREFDLATDDELRIIQFLLADTTLKIKVNGKYGLSFETLMGTPQGDALSPVLFLIYLEYIMRTFPGRATEMKGDDRSMAYADDVSFIMREKSSEIRDRRNRAVDHVCPEDCECIDCRANRLLQLLPGHFALSNMQVNLTKSTDDEMSVRKCTVKGVLGSDINGTIEVELRIGKSTKAFNMLHRVWKAHQITIGTRMKIFNATVLSLLTQSAGATAFTRRNLDKLDAHHRTLLRRLLGVYWPNKISNIQVYEMTSATPITISVIRARWSLLGHLLRLAEQDDSIPAWKIMVQYFQRKPTQQEEARSATRRGRVLTTVPRLIELDIMGLYKKRRVNGIEKRVTSKNEKNRIKGILGIENLTNGNELLLLRMKAQNRTLWDKARDAIAAAALAALTKKMAEKSAKRREIRDNRNERAQQEIDNAAPVDMPGAHV